MGNNSIPYNRSALIVSSYVSIVSQKLDLILLQGDVESCHSLSVAVSTNALVLTHVHPEIPFLNVHIQTDLVEILW